MESNWLTEHAQSLLRGVQRESPRGKGELVIGIIMLIIKIN